jgi:hypothetical protein
MKHPGKTAAQRRVLDLVGCGDYCPPAKRATLDKMVEQGLLIRLPDKRIGSDSFGVIALPQFEMPIPVHYAWCSYWAEQEDAGYDQ